MRIYWEKQPIDNYDSEWNQRLPALTHQHIWHGYTDEGTRYAIQKMEAGPMGSGRFYYSVSGPSLARVRPTLAQTKREAQIHEDECTGRPGEHSERCKTGRAKQSVE